MLIGKKGARDRTGSLLLLCRGGLVTLKQPYMDALPPEARSAKQTSADRVKERSEVNDKLAQAIAGYVATGVTCSPVDSNLLAVACSSSSRPSDGAVVLVHIKLEHNQTIRAPCPLAHAFAASGRWLVLATSVGLTAHPVPSASCYVAAQPVGLSDAKGLSAPPKAKRAAKEAKDAAQAAWTAEANSESRGERLALVTAEAVGDLWGQRHLVREESASRQEPPLALLPALLDEATDGWLVLRPSSVALYTVVDVASEESERPRWDWEKVVRQVDELGLGSGFPGRRDRDELCAACCVEGWAPLDPDEAAATPQRTVWLVASRAGVVVLLDGASLRSLSEPVQLASLAAGHGAAAGDGAADGPLLVSLAVARDALPAGRACAAGFADGSVGLFALSDIACS